MCSVSNLDTITDMTYVFPPFTDKVTLLGGGELTQATVSQMLTLAPNLVAADGAAHWAIEMGLPLARVIGDMDSLSAPDRAALPAAIIQEIREQDSTDFDKALRSIDAPMILGVGFMGRRLDHELAAFSSLVRQADRKCILVGEHDICFHVPEKLEIHLTPGTRFSLFPMAGLTAHARGLKWPVDNMNMSPWGRVGTSNEVVSPRVTLRFDRPGMLVILARSALKPAIRALESAV